jgi:hypothetical protein
MPKSKEIIDSSDDKSTEDELIKKKDQVIFF